MLSPTGLYYLDENKRTVPVPNDHIRILAWKAWRDRADLEIARTRVAPGIVVITMFLGEDQREPNVPDDGKPLLFRTSVVTDYGEDPRWDTPTYDDALRMHQATAGNERWKFKNT